MGWNTDGSSAQWPTYAFNLSFPNAPVVILVKGLLRYGQAINCGRNCMDTIGASRDCCLAHSTPRPRRSREMSKQSLRRVPARARQAAKEFLQKWKHHVAVAYPALSSRLTNDASK